MCVVGRVSLVGASRHTINLLYFLVLPAAFAFCSPPLASLLSLRSAGSSASSLPSPRPRTPTSPTGAAHPSADLIYARCLFCVPHVPLSSPTSNTGTSAAARPSKGYWYTTRLRPRLFARAFSPSRRLCFRAVVAWRRVCRSAVAWASCTCLASYLS